MGVNWTKEEIVTKLSLAVGEKASQVTQKAETKTCPLCLLGKIKNSDIENFVRGLLNSDHCNNLY